MKKLILNRFKKAVSIMLTAILLLSTIAFEIVAADPKVSIIIPVYNTPENLLRDCLNSAKNQTLKDIEIICVDDGSTDGSGKILDEYAKSDPRFVVVHQENKGLSGARNRGMEIAKGEYIKFLDSDDMIDDVTAEKSYNVAKEYDADITRYSVKDCERAKNSWARFLYEEKFEFINDTSRNFRKLFTKHRFFVAWGALFKNKFLKDNSIKFFQTIRFGHEDVMFNFLCYFHATKVIFMPDRLYTYRFNNQSLITRPDFGDALRNSATEGIKYLYSHFKDLGYLNNLDMKIDFLNLILKHHEFAVVRDKPSFQKSFIESIDPNLLQDNIINQLPVREKIQLKSMIQRSNPQTKPQKALNDGIYTISSKLDPNYCLGIKNGSKNNCANLQLLGRICLAVLKIYCNAQKIKETLKSGLLFQMEMVIVSYCLGVMIFVWMFMVLKLKMAPTFTAGVCMETITKGLSLKNARINRVQANQIRLKKLPVNLGQKSQLKLGKKHINRARIKKIRASQV